MLLCKIHKTNFTQASIFLIGAYLYWMMVRLVSVWSSAGASYRYSGTSTLRKDRRNNNNEGPGLIHIKDLVTPPVLGRLSPCHRARPGEFVGEHLVTGPLQTGPC